MNTSWIEQAKQKLAAATQSQDDKAITEAFAQQAYTAIGNRDREIMRDPHMLGFEIVSKNEENTRLVGVFAFRVSNEILLVPVFYLNGQIKGQDLLYRKGVNRFVPNTDKWVAYLLTRGEDLEGRPVDRKALDARIHLDLRQMAGSRLKTASHDCCDACKQGEKCTCKDPSADYDPNTTVITNLPDDATAEEKKQWEERGFIRRGTEKLASIRGLWLESMGAWKAEEPQHIFAQVVTEQGMQKEAAALAERWPEFAEMLELAGSLEQPVKTATAAAPELTLFREPADGWSEAELESFYKQGFALRDSRDMKYLADAYVESDMSCAVSTLHTAGVQTVTDADDQRASVLWAPLLDPDAGTYPSAGLPAVGSAYQNDRTLGAAYGMLYLDGPDKGAYLRYASSTPGTDVPVFQCDETVDGPEQAQAMVDTQVKGETPKAGKTYVVWLPALRKIIPPFAVGSLQKNGEVTKINFDSNCGFRLVINAGLEVTNEQDIQTTRVEGLPCILGRDAVFVPVECNITYSNGPRTAENISWVTPVPPSTFRPITAGRLGDSLLKTKTAAVTLIPVGHGRTDVSINGRRRAEELDLPELAFKLAGALHLPADQAVEFAVQAAGGDRVTFNLISPAQKAKLASAYYERYIDPTTEFQDLDYDQDLNVPIHDPRQNQAITQLMRQQQVSPQRRYLDAVGNSGPRNKPHTHIPDEVIMQMTNPMQEMAQLGEQMGLKSLLDHGAIGSLTKVFDAAPFIQEYVEKLESSLDYLARLLFMLYWKPKDFADAFGTDDLPNLENKLTGVFLAYGDLVLELRQSSGDKN